MKFSCINIFCLFIIIIFIYYFYEQYYIESINGNLIDDNIIYIKNYLNYNDFVYIKNLFNKNNDDLIYEKFRYTKPIYDNHILDIIYSRESILKIQSLINNRIYKSKFPPEYRIYPSNSQGMPWHSDTLLYDKPQYEVILTLSNNSNSETHWIDANNKLNTLWTEPNSILIVKANGYKHHVTPITNNGTRSIIKYILTQSNTINNNYLRELSRFK